MPKISKFDRQMGQIEDKKCIQLIQSTIYKYDYSDDMAKAIFKKLKPFIRWYKGE